MTSAPKAARRDGPDRLLIAAGLAQCLAAFAPAARVRLLGGIAFVRLPSAGVALIGLGLLTLLVAWRPRGWWRWLPGALSALALAFVYWRVRWTPSGWFVDPLLRYMLRPSWGFLPMGAAILLSLLAAARVRPPRASSPGPT